MNPDIKRLRATRLPMTVRRSSLAIALALAAVGLLTPLYLLHARGVRAPSNPGGPFMRMQNESGIISRLGVHSVDETVSKVQALLRERDITLFAVIDHSSEAAKVGLTLRPTKLLIFGNPKGGTPVMLAAPSSAIDLPLKLLVWQDADGKTWLSYNDPKYLQNRHHIPAELVQNLGIVGVLAEQAAQ